MVEDWLDSACTVSELSLLVELREETSATVKLSLSPSSPTLSP